MYTDRKTDGAPLTHYCPVVKSNTLTRSNTAPFTALSELTAAPYSSTSHSPHPKRRLQMMKGRERKENRKTILKHVSHSASTTARMFMMVVDSMNSIVALLSERASMEERNDERVNQSRAQLRLRRKEGASDKKLPIKRNKTLNRTHPWEGPRAFQGQQVRNALRR